MSNCPHKKVVPFATPGSFWKCKDCGELFYLHPTDHSQHGIFCCPEICGGPPKEEPK